MALQREVGEDCVVSTTDKTYLSSHYFIGFDKRDRNHNNLYKDDGDAGDDDDHPFIRGDLSMCMVPILSTALLYSRYMAAACFVVDRHALKILSARV